MKYSEYALKRPSFQLDPEVDAVMFVGREDVKKRLEDRLRLATVTGKSLRILIHGDYGSGKTHLLNYLSRFLEKNEPNVLTVFVRVLRITKSSKPSLLYSSIMNEIPESGIFDLFAKVRETNQCVKNKDLAQVIARARTERRMVKRWLAGERISARDKKKLGVISDNSDPVIGVQTLCALFGLFNEVKKKYIVVMIDEWEILNILSRRKQHEFSRFLGRMFEIKGHGVALLLGAATGPCLDPSTAGLDIAQVTLGRGPSARYLFYQQDYVFLNEFEDLNSMKVFVKKLIAALRDDRVDAKALVKRSQSKTQERLSLDFFPFTDEAVETMFKLALANEVLRLVSPREIEKILTDALGFAMFHKNPFIDSQIITRIMASG